VVTAKPGKGAALKVLRRIMKEYGSPRGVVTDGLSGCSAPMNEIGNGMRWAVASTIERKIRTNPFDGESGRCSVFEA
jgi:hypothetical protein